MPTATFRLLYGFLVLLHDRRRVAHFAVTERPRAAWVAQQLREAFPYDTAPRYLIRDRDGIYGEEVRRCLKGMGIEEVLTAPCSPWQKGYASSCTPFVSSEATSGHRRGSVSLIPWAFLGPLTPTDS